MSVYTLRSKALLRVLRVGAQQTELRIRQHFMDTPVQQVIHEEIALVLHLGCAGLRTANHRVQL